MATFEPGDVVQMKSGGPIMTVEKVDVDGGVVCHWFGEKNKQEKGTFPGVVLEVYDEPAGFGVS
jgi:uncharacterized protein YodC (DUF2158 family)